MTPCKPQRKTEDGRIIVDDMDQLENEKLHIIGECRNHVMERVPSATRPQWMNVTCTCGMRISISPEVEAELDRLNAEDYR